jgi:hypothetical protein
MNQPASNRNARSTCSPEQETALLLELCEAQIDAALRDSDKSVEVLTNVFFQLIAAIDSLGETAKQVGASAPSQTASGQPTTHDELRERCGNVTEQINSAVVAFQFYDKLTQRLDHVRHSLTTLALFVCDSDKSRHSDQWVKMRSSLRRLYRTAEERKIFESIAGPPDDSETSSPQNFAPESSVELF